MAESSIRHGKEWMAPGQETVVILGFCERASTSVKMGGIGSAIWMRTEKRKMYTVGVWTRTVSYTHLDVYKRQYQFRNRVNF